MAHVTVNLTICIDDEALLMKRGAAIVRRRWGKRALEDYRNDYLDEDTGKVDPHELLRLFAQDVVLWNRASAYFERCGVEIEVSESEYWEA